jgi:hypothetical protein
MSKRIQDLGTGAFMGDPELKCHIYEWSNPEMFGQFKLKFCCPIDEYPRRFYVDLVLQNWMNPAKQNGFLESACKHGYKFLAAFDKPELERKPKLDQRANLPAFLALFRNRNEGHTKVGRTFSHQQDWIEYDLERSSAELIAAGVQSDSILWEGGDRSKIAKRLFGKAKLEPFGRIPFQPTMLIKHYADVATHDLVERLEGSPNYRRLCELNIEELREFLETHVDESRNDACSPPNDAPQPSAKCDSAPQAIFRNIRLDELPNRSTLDQYFTDGLWRIEDFDLERAASIVRQALIYGPCSLEDDQAARKDLQFPRFIQLIRAAAKKYKPDGFRKWLCNERQHMYVRLLEGGRGLSGEDKERVEERAKRMFCAALWDSYQQMARCYGALMFIIWIHFTLEFKLSWQENAMFRQLNFPQLYLAGLPLAFMNVNHWRWIGGPLLERWSYDGELVADAYDPVNQVLGIYADLTQRRRETERQEKTYKTAERSRTDTELDQQLAPSPSDWSEDVDTVMALPELKSTKCPRCNEEMYARYCQFVEGREDLAHVITFCYKCKKFYDYRRHTKPGSEE